MSQYPKKLQHQNSLVPSDSDQSLGTSEKYFLTPDTGIFFNSDVKEISPKETCSTSKSLQHKSFEGNLNSSLFEPMQLRISGPFQSNSRTTPKNTQNLHVI